MLSEILFLQFVMYVRLVWGIIHLVRILKIIVKKVIVKIESSWSVYDSCLSKRTGGGHVLQVLEVCDVSSVWRKPCEAQQGYRRQRRTFALEEAINSNMLLLYRRSKYSASLWAIPSPSLLAMSNISSHVECFV